MVFHDKLDQFELFSHLHHFNRNMILSLFVTSGHLWTVIFTSGKKGLSGKVIKVSGSIKIFAGLILSFANNCTFAVKRFFIPHNLFENIVSMIITFCILICNYLIFVFHITVSFHLNITLTCRKTSTKKYDQGYSWDVPFFELKGN